MKITKTCLSYFLFVSLFVLTACRSSKVDKDFVYFNDGKESTAEVLLKEPVIQPNDLLSIQVFSKTLNQEQASLFNIPNGTGAGAGGYQVNTFGTVDIPLVGSVKAAGLTRDQLESALADKLSPYVKDPSVIIRFLQFKINVLGEVQSPGTKSFETDGVTIVDAIGAAGDLTDNGSRKDVLIIRSEGGKKVYHSLDLGNRNLFSSPVYQLQQNDIVYVAPNRNKIKILKANPVAQRNLQLGLTMISLAATILSVIAILTK